MFVVCVGGRGGGTFTDPLLFIAVYHPNFPATFDGRFDVDLYGSPNPDLWYHRIYSAE